MKPHNTPDPTPVNQTAISSYSIAHLLLATDVGITVLFTGVGSGVLCGFIMGIMWFHHTAFRDGILHAPCFCALYTVSSIPTSLSFF